MANTKLAIVLALALLAPLPSAWGCSYCPTPTTGLPSNPPSWSPISCPSPRYNALTRQCPSWQIPVGVCCGGANGPACPAISCSTAFSYSSSGSGQCASSYSTISAATISKSQFVALTNATTPMLAQYCQISPVPGVNDVSATSSALANLYADAVAATLIYHSQFVCLNQYQNTANGGCTRAYCPTCNGGNAISVVQASVQAVAQAGAIAFGESTAAIYDVYGVTIAYSDAQSTAVANAINTAVGTYYNKLSQPNWFSASDCTTSKPATQVKTAVAEALACVFTQVLVSVYDAALQSTNPDDNGVLVADTPNAASCASSYALAWSIGATQTQLTCPNITCPVSEVCNDPSGSSCSSYNGDGVASTGSSGSDTQGSTGRKLLL